MSPTIDGQGRITDWKKVVEFEGRVVTNASTPPALPAIEATKIAGIDFNTLLSPYKDKKIKLIIEVQLEG